MRHALLTGRDAVPLAALALVLVARSAAAQNAATGPVALHWSAPPDRGCPDLPAAIARLDALLGGAHGAQSIDAQVTIAHTRAGPWRVTLATRTAHAAGERHLESATCNGAADAALVMIALAVDTDVDAVAPAPVAAPVHARPRSPDLRTTFVDAERPPVLRPQRVRPRPTAHRPGLLLAVGASADVGSLPRIAPGLAAAVGVRWDHSELTLSAVLYAAQTITTSDGGEADLAIAGVGLRGCRDVAGRVVVLRACGLAEAGSLRGSAGSASGSGLWGGLAGGPMVAWTADARFELRATLDGGITLLYPRFQGAGNTTLFEPSRLYARGALAVAVRF